MTGYLQRAGGARALKAATLGRRRRGGALSSPAIWPVAAMDDDAHRSEAVARLYTGMAAAGPTKPEFGIT